MMGTTHRTGSLAISSAMVACLPLLNLSSPDFVWLPTSKNVFMAAGFIFLALFGGILPDADTPQSTIGRRYRIVLFPLYGIRKLISFLGNFFKPFAKISKALGHRGLFHSPLIWTVIFAILRFFTYSAGDFIACLCSGLYFGILSHILLDYISGGVPLLAPFTMKRYKPPFKLKTGGMLEFFINLLFLAVSVSMLIFYAQSFFSK